MIDSAANARRGNQLPLGLAPGAVVKKPVETGQVITYDDVELDESLMIVHLRRLQDLELAR